MNRARLVALALVTSALVVMPGCAGPGGAPQGQTPAYAQGYSDGCASGRASQGGMYDFEKKDISRFATDKQYAEGWTDAFQKCAYEQRQTMSAGH